MENINWKEDLSLKIKIEKSIKEQNYFWWGCVIGIEYGKISTIRVDKEEEPKSSDFTPIVRVKYGSPYKNSPKVGHIISWY